MASVIMNVFKRDVFGGVISLSATNFYCSLMTSAISLSSTDQIRDATAWSQLSACETSGTGYTTGGVLMSALSVSADFTNDRAIWDGGDLTWYDSTITAYGAIIRTSGTNTPCVYFDFGENKSSQSGPFTISWSSNGIIRGS